MDILLFMSYYNTLPQTEKYYNTGIFNALLMVHLLYLIFDINAMHVYFNICLDVIFLYLNKCILKNMRLDVNIKIHFEIM